MTNTTQCQILFKFVSESTTHNDSLTCSMAPWLQARQLWSLLLLLASQTNKTIGKDRESSLSSLYSGTFHQSYLWMFEWPVSRRCSRRTKRWTTPDREWHVLFGRTELSGGPPLIARAPVLMALFNVLTPSVHRAVLMRIACSCMCVCLGGVACFVCAV